MNETEALARIEEKIAGRLSRARAWDVVGSATAGYDRGVVSALTLALEDVQAIRSLFAAREHELLSPEILAGWIPREKDELAPNPVIGTRPLADGGTARLYRNRKVDAIDGATYSLSLGFDSIEELEAWIANGGREPSSRVAS